MKQNTPPRFFLRFFQWYCHPKLLKYIEGDLMELYDERLKLYGKRKADIKFIIDVLLLLRPGIIRPAQEYHSVNNYAMVKSYFKIGWRNLLRNKGYSIINIGGLAVGMTVALLIGLWIYDELSYNTYHKNYDRIAQVLVSGSNNSGRFVQWNTSPPFGNEIRNLYGTEFKHVLMSSRPNSGTMAWGENKIIKTGYFMETGVAEMLTLTMLKGTRAGLLNKESMFLSESTAKTLFGDVDPMDKTIKIDNRMDVVVTGVYEDLPANSDFNDLQFLGTWDLYLSSNEWIRNEDWRQNGFYTFVELADNTSLQTASNKIKDIKLHKVNEEEAAFKPQLFLHPMNKWRLYSDLENGSGRIKYVWLNGSIGLFVLLLACINFMNLATARSEQRAKEVGIRKSMGSVRSQLMSQFFSESLLVTAFAFFFSLCLAQVALPLFNDIANKRINIPWSHPLFWLMGLGFCAFTGILAGSYPALYLSSFKPVRVLKGVLQGRTASLPRKVLVVIQFTVSITLTIGVIVVFQQIQFSKERSVGYNREGLIWVNTSTPEVHDHIDAVRDELKKSGGAIEIAESLNPVTTVGFRIGGYDWTGTGPDEAGFGTAWVGYEFGKTVGWQFIDGRDFSKEYASDTLGMVLNETAVKYMNLKDPVGKTIKHTLFDKTTSYKVIGVIKDMLMESPYEPVRKMVYMFDTRYWNKGGSIVNIRLNPEMNTQKAVNRIELIFKKYDAASPFVYQFADEAYSRKFSEEEHLGKLVFMFSALAIFISCLGILGLASFIAEQRTKEIGVRKILGASVMQLWQLLSKDFVRLAIISCLIAIPLSYYFMNDWLQKYEYRTTLSWYVFVAASAGALGITLLTVSFQAIKAAMANPVDSLRSE